MSSAVSHIASMPTLVNDPCPECGGAGIYVADGELRDCPCEGASSYKCQRATYDSQEWVEQILEYGRNQGFWIFYCLEPRFCYDCDSWHIRIREEIE